MQNLENKIKTEDTKKTATKNVAEEEVLTDEVAEEAPLDTSKMFVKDLQKALKARNLPIREGGKLLNKKQLKQRLDDAIAKEQAPEEITHNDIIKAKGGKDFLGSDEQMVYGILENLGTILSFDSKTLPETVTKVEAQLKDYLKIAI